MKRFACTLGSAILAAALNSHTAPTEDQGYGQEVYQTAEEGYGKTNQEIYGRGSYAIEVDMSAGEYAVLTGDTSENHVSSSCTFTLYKNDRGEKRTDMFRFQYHELTALYSGQHLVLSRGYAVLTDQADISAGTTGMYKVGRDMEPGTYRLTPLTSDGAHYTLCNNVRYYYDRMDDYQTLFELVTVTLEEGQYIELMNVNSVEKID